MIYGTSTSSFPDDGYGVSTDNPPSAYEVIDNALKLEQQRAIRNDFNDWIRYKAQEFFTTGEWGEEEWDAWRDIVMEII